MIVGGKIEGIEAAKTKEGKIDGLSINITFDDVIVKGELIEVKYTYSAKYEKDMGEIKIKGSIVTKETKKFAKEVADGWKKDEKKRKLPPEYTNALLSAINYTGSANGTLIARVMNMSPPLVPPKLEVSK